VYRTKRDSHVAWLLEAANRHAQRCGARAVTQEEAKDMVEFSSFTIVINGTSLGQEFGPGCVGRSCRIARCTRPAALCTRCLSRCCRRATLTLGCRYKVPADVLEQDYQSAQLADPMAVYPLFRAWFRWESLGRQSPGAQPDFEAVVGMVCGDVGVPQQRLDVAYAQEMQRCWDHASGGPVEVATVASVIGGIAANEAVKHIVGKFVPNNNTIIYDGANLEYSVDFKA